MASPNNYKEDEYKKIFSHTATKETVDHYKRCEKAILALCKHGDYICSLIGDNWRWYKVNFEEKKAKLWLASEENYDYLTQKHRTLYWTLQLWSPEIEKETRSWIQKPNGKWGIDALKEGPLGTRKETRLMTLSVDIDRAKAKEVTEPNVKKWLEAALKLFADYFKSISFQSYALFFSGGGSYVMVHPLVTAIGEGEKHDIVYRWEMVQQCFDIFISEMEKQFFEKYPEAKEWIKGFDCLNYDAKRQFKLPLSIHLTKPFAVIPLDKENPTIDFDKARLPISDEVIAETANCLQFYEGDDERFGKHIIKVYADRAKEVIGERHPINQTFEAVPDTKEVDVSKWAPCARNMYNESKVEGKGITRRLAFLANYMRFVGVPREKAYNIFIRKAQEWRGETTNIFENKYDHDGDPKCFIRNCVNFNKESTGYPGMGFGGLGLCTPDVCCKQIKHPLQYHKQKEEGGPAQISLKYEENDFGVLTLEKCGNDVAISIKKEGVDAPIIPKELRPCNFCIRPKIRDYVFSHVKKELSEDEYKRFLEAITPQIENALKPKKEKETQKKKEIAFSVDEIKNLEDDNGKGIIANYVIYKKVLDGRPRRFTVKVHLEDGEIKEEVEPERHSIPEQTAPTVNFCDADCDSLKEIYNKLKGIHTDYVAFGPDSIYPTLTALGSMASYFREAFYTYPYFDFISGEPETGKTTAMKTLVFTSFYGTVASSVSEALLFREIDSSHCFYGLDNIERIFARPKDYAGIIDWLLSSYSRDIPCKRLAKVDDDFVVVSFDGYGEKAFTHITDFPVQLSTLKSRCIQIVMQKGKPTKVYPTPGKFAGIRDKMYHARLREYQKVKDTYETLIISNVLKGRTGDLYYPLLAIAKLISEDVYEKVLKYAKETERERTEVDEWSRELINLLYDEGIYGSISPKDIRSQYQDRLRDAGLLKEEKDIYTRTVTNKLKKLGFKRDSKKTDHKTWFIIDEKTVLQRAQEYDIVDTPQEGNFVTLPTFEKDKTKQKEEEAGENSNKETSSGGNDLDRNESKGKVTKVKKVTNRGVLEKEKPTPIEIKKFTIGTSKCKECGNKEVDLIYVVFYSNGEFKYVCEDCGEQIMHDCDMKLSVGGSDQ